MEDKETAGDMDADVDADADVDELGNSVCDSTAGHTATASTVAPDVSPSRKATLTARPTIRGRTAATTTVMPAADGEEQPALTTKQATFLEHAVVPPKKYSNHATIVDTGATRHYLDNAAEQYYTDVKHTSTGPSVKVANGENIETSKRALVPLAKELSTKAKVGHIFNGLQSGSLISIGQLCGNDYVALFKKYNVKIYNDGKAIVIGQCNDVNGLWNAPLVLKETQTPHTQHSANGAIKNVRTKRNHTAFLHACAFSPLPSTFLRAIQHGHSESWPSLTITLMTKHLAKSLATSMGHLRMEQQKSSRPRSLPTST